MRNEKRAYKEGKKSAIDAVVVSRARHLADNEFKDKHNDPEDREKYAFIARKLSDEKVENLVKVVDAADESNDRISVDIADDIGYTKTITADFDPEDGHMSLHVIRGSHKKLDKDREGRQKSTGYGENNEFIKNTTGKDVKMLAKDKFEKEKKRVGLKEDQCEILTESTESRRKRLILNSIKFIPEEVFDKNFPELKEKSFNEKVKTLKEKINSIPDEDMKKLLNSPKLVNLEKELEDNKSKLGKRFLQIGGGTTGASVAVGAGFLTQAALATGMDGLGYAVLAICSGYAAIGAAAITIIGATTGGIINMVKTKKYLKSRTPELLDILKSEGILKENLFDNDGINILIESLEFNQDIKFMTLEDAIREDLPFRDVIIQMKDVKYGFINKRTGERCEDREWIHNVPNLSHYYETNFDPKVTLNNKLGICLDQSLAIKYLFGKFHPDVKCQIMALTKGRFGHAVPIFNYEDAWYYLENAWDKERGLHGKFESEEKIREYLAEIYHKHHDGDNNDPVNVRTYEEYAGLRESLSFR